MTTAEKIKFLRERKGMTQEELGKKIGVQRSAVTKYEKGRVVNLKRSTLQKLADALDVSPAVLLDDDDGIYITEEGAFLVAELPSIEEEICRKVKELRPDEQRMVLVLIDGFIDGRSMYVEGSEYDD